MHGSIPKGMPHNSRRTLRQPSAKKKHEAPVAALRHCTLRNPPRRFCDRERKKCRPPAEGGTDAGGLAPPYVFIPLGRGRIFPLRGLGFSPMEFRQAFDVAFFPLPRLAVLRRPLFLCARRAFAHRTHASLGRHPRNDNFITFGRCCIAAALPCRAIPSNLAATTTGTGKAPCRTVRAAR